MNRPGKPGRLNSHNGDTHATEKRTVRPGPRILTRCADYPGAGRAIGAWIIDWGPATDLYVCGCCSDLIPAGGLLVEVEHPRDGRHMAVCGDCAGPLR